MGQWGLQKFRARMEIDNGFLLGMKKMFKIR